MTKIFLKTIVISLITLVSFPAISASQSSGSSTQGCFTYSIDEEDCESTWGSSLPRFPPNYSAFSEVTWEANPENISIHVRVWVGLYVDGALVSTNEDSAVGTGASGTVTASVSDTFAVCDDVPENLADTAVLKVLHIIANARVQEEVTKIYPCP